MTNPVPNGRTSFPREKIRVLLLEGISQTAIDEFTAQGFQVDARQKALNEDELCKAVEDIHLLGIRSKTQITPKVLQHSRRMLAAGCFCIGTNQVALGAANLAGIPVFNAPFSNTRSVAELVIAEVIALSRHLFDRSSEIHRGEWNKSALGSHEIRGKTLGIIGYGHIGSQVGVLAEMLGMRVVYYDVQTKLPLGNNRPIAKMEELLRVSDFVTLHVPATQQTHEMIGPAELALLQKHACLLNLSRGTVVVIDALVAAIKEGRLGGAALDVYPEEPEGNKSTFKSPLLGLPNVILTPHIGGSTEEAQAAIGTEVATSLIKFMNLGTTSGSVNFPQIEAAATRGAHRILNVHRNVPGVLRDVNKIVSDFGANIRGQVLSTDTDIGYLVMDLDHDVSDAVCKAVSELSTNIKTRILY